MLKKVENKSDFEYFANARPEMLPFVPDECKKILECGCGDGAFGELVKQQRDCDYYGIELFPEAAKIAETRLDKVFTGDLGEILDSFSDESYDCAIFNDVLEHLANPFEILERLRPKVKPGGYVVSSIPNVRYIGNLRRLLLQKDWEYRHEGGILDFTHLRFFTQKSIARMYELSGYDIVKNEGINPIGGIIMKLLELLSLGNLSDTKFIQFATVARKK